MGNNKKVDLSEYEQYSIFLYVFDVLIKNTKTEGKEKYLKSKGISPSTYRRTKLHQTKASTSKILVDDLCVFLEYKQIDTSTIREIENVINDIYDKIYYKKEVDIYKWLTYFKNLIDEKSIIFPIAHLMRLFILITKNNPSKIISSYKEEYEQILKYKDFFIGGLEEIYEIVNIAFIKDLNNTILFTKYKNELTYYTLANKCYLLNDLTNCYRLITMCEESFIEKRNYKRMYYLDALKMAYYNKIKSYEDAYLLGDYNLKSIESMNDSQNLFEKELRLFKLHVSISCIGLRKYEEAFNMVISNKRLNNNEICCLIFLNYLFNINVEKYINKKREYLKNLIENMIDENKKSAFDVLEQHSVSSVIVDFFKGLL